MNVEQIDRVYSAYSSFYDIIFGRLFHSSRGSAIALLDLKPGDHVLEVGVGTGLSIPHYRRDCRVTGVDICEPMLSRGRRRVRRLGLDNIDLRQMDAGKMDFPNDTFDAVFGAYVISAVPNPQSVMEEMVRVCKPGGKIVLLNHFSNGNPIISRVERWISPLTRKIGWSADLSLETVLDGVPLTVLRKAKMKPLNYWKVVQCVNEKTNGSVRC